MQFSACWLGNGNERHFDAKIWLRSPESAILRFILPDNTLEAWVLALKKFVVQEPSLAQDVERALCDGAVSFIYLTIKKVEARKALQESMEMLEDAILERLAFCKFCLAWNRAYPASKISILDFLENNTPLRTSFLPYWPFNWLFLWTDGKWRDNDAADIQPLKDFYLVSLKRLTDVGEGRTEIIKFFLEYFFSNLDLLRAMNRERVSRQPASANRTRSAYAGLVMAALEVLNNTGHNISFDMRNGWSLIYGRTALWALLAENEAFPLTERQMYIKWLFDAGVSEHHRKLFLTSVLEDLGEEAQNDLASHHVVETIASFMAQNYLDRYMLDEAVSIWSQVQHLKRERWLQIILGVYHKPLPWLLVASGWLILSWLLPGIAKVIVGSLGLFGLYGSATFTLGIIATRFLQKQGFSSIELFLPRLVGAVLVGLSILALENTVWEISVRLPLTSWAFLSLASYLGALTYIFLNVHKTTRLLPVGIDNRLSPIIPRKTRKTSALMSRSVGISWRIFAIGALESLGLTTLIVSILPLDHYFNAGASIPLLHGLTVKLFCSQGFVWTWSSFLHLTHFPKVIILWAGLALFLGAFAQLLWQDRQVTAS